MIFSGGGEMIETCCCTIFGGGWGKRQNDCCNLLFYLTAKHTFENFKGVNRLFVSPWLAVTEGARTGIWWCGRRSCIPVPSGARHLCYQSSARASALDHSAPRDLTCDWFEKKRRAELPRCSEHRVAKSCVVKNCDVKLWNVLN